MLGCYANAEVAGFVSLTQHFDTTADIYLLAAAATLARDRAGARAHRRGGKLGAGARLAFLSVKTLGPSHPDPSYEASRRFYRAMGFAPIEEIQDVWPGNARACCCIPQDARANV